MVVADPCLIASGGTGRFDAADDARVHEGRERVVHGLLGDAADLLARGVGDGVGRGVGLGLHGLQDRNALRGHLEPMPLEDLSASHHVGQTRSRI